jgi:hypothetical protein
MGIVLLSGCGSSGGAKSSSPTAAGVNPNAKEQLPPGDIPDNQVYVTYTPPAGGFTISYPQGWSKSGTAAATTFSQYLNSIELLTTQTPTQPTTASAQNLASTTLRALKGFKLVKIDSVTRHAGPAVHIVYDATSSVNTVTGKTVTLQVERYLFWHKGTLLTIVLSSAKGSDNVDPWKTVTDSLAWK